MQKFLTEHGFIHRDLSTRNVLVGDRLCVKIANPGMYQEGYYYVVTEREHFLQDMAPECIWEKRYSMWSDVWSYGVFTYKVVTLGKYPWGTTGKEERGTTGVKLRRGVIVMVVCSLLPIHLKKQVNWRKYGQYRNRRLHGTVHIGAKSISLVPRLGWLHEQYGSKFRWSSTDHWNA